MPADWRDASPNYITYASTPHKNEAPHPYLSLDAVVNLTYEVGEFGRSIDETPPRSRFDRNRRVRRVDVEGVESSSSSSTSILGEEGEGEGDDREDGDPVGEMDELSEYLENNSIAGIGEDSATNGGETNADDEATSLYEASINETVFEAMDEAVNDPEFVDEDSSTKGGQKNDKRKKKEDRGGKDAVKQAPGKGSLKDLLVEVDGESSERVNRFERN